MSDPKNPPKDPNDPSPFPPVPQPQPAVQIQIGGAPDPRVAIPLSDASLGEIYDGLEIPNPLAIKRMAYELKKWRGEDPSRA